MEPAILRRVRQMSEIGVVERVARAIAEGWKGGWDDVAHREAFRADARAAIEAMREPTDAMVRAGHLGATAAAWRAMVDAALAEPPA